MVEKMLAQTGTHNAQNTEPLSEEDCDALLDKIAPLINEQQKRDMIACYFVGGLGMPPPEEWDGHSGT
eukprot:2970058-Prymnesium_polylepis.1